MLKPKSEETKSEYMSRGIDFLVNKGIPNEQAVAVCSLMWQGKSFKDALKEYKSKKIGNEILK